MLVLLVAEKRAAPDDDEDDKEIVLSPKKKKLEGDVPMDVVKEIVSNITDPSQMLGPEVRQVSKHMLIAITM